MSLWLYDRCRQETLVGWVEVQAATELYSASVGFKGCQWTGMACTSVIPTLGRLRWGDHEFGTTLDCIMGPCPKGGREGRRSRVGWGNPEDPLVSLGALTCPDINS